VRARGEAVLEAADQPGQSTDDDNEAQRSKKLGAAIDASDRPEKRETDPEQQSRKVPKVTVEIDRTLETAHHVRTLKRTDSARADRYYRGENDYRLAQAPLAACIQPHDQAVRKRSARPFMQ
jgi:hypothetical protein